MRYLVELLASKNSQPEQDDQRLIVPENYDKNHQAVVYLAIQQLLAEGADAFDVLLEHRDDKRYCYSYESPQGRFSLRVGRVCTAIVRRNVAPYEGKLRSISGAQRNVYPGPHVKLEDWWKQNRTRPLWEIQVDAIDHAIKFMESADRDKVSSWFVDAPKLPAEKFEEGRQENLKTLRGMRLATATANEAHRPTTIDTAFGKMILLPWQDK